MRILVINPGATSTKIAVYEEETEAFSASLSHAPEELSGFVRVVDQLPLREVELPASSLDELETRITASERALASVRTARSVWWKARQAGSNATPM